MMMRTLWIGWVSLWPFLLLVGNPVELKEAPNVSTTEGLPSGLVNQSVSTISGEYTDSVLDVVIPGPESLVISRVYSNQSKGNLGVSWSFNHRDKVILGHAIYNEQQPVWVIGLRQPSGTQLDYIYPKNRDKSKKNHLQFELIVPKGFTNGAQNLSGRTNIKNQVVHFYSDEEKIVSVSGAGNRSTFVKIGRMGEEGWTVCGQQKEEKVNGSVYTYECKGKDLLSVSQIVCQSGKTGQRYSKVKLEVIDQSNEHPILALKTSDDRQLKYHFKQHKFKRVEKGKTTEDIFHTTSYYLSKVENPSAPTEVYEYEQKELSKELQIACKKRPEGRFIKTSYYHKGTNLVGGEVGSIVIDEEDDYRLDRVKKQQAPVGTDKKPITTHRFVYQCKVKKNKHDHYQELMEGLTDVYDAYNHRTRYRYDENHRLESITHYSGVSDYLPYQKESFLWGKKSDQEGNLLGKIVKDGKGKVYQARYFTYDAKGNVLTNTLCGRLTGLPAADISLNSSKYPIENGYEFERKIYTYSQDGFNLVLSETDSNGKMTIYDYIKGTDHLKATYIIYDGQIQLREFYFYDDHDVLITTIKDDGKSSSCEDLTGVTERYYTTVTPRQTAPFGLPERIEESYLDLSTGQKNVLSSSCFHYSMQGKLLKKECFDSCQQPICTLLWEYDAHGNITKETNALGQVMIKRYDANDNLIFQQGPSFDFYIQNTYDFANRLISQEEVHNDGRHFTTTHTYDYLGHCIVTSDAYGHETHQTFDDFGRVVAIQYPAVLNEEGQLVNPFVLREYDIAGYPICLTDAKGRKTYTEYNIRGKPTKITHPNQTVEQFIYRLDGELVQKIERNGTRIVYTRDALGRVTDESIYASDGELLNKTQNIYNVFHLLYSIDFNGCVTSYSYDAAGRLEWIRQGERVQHSLYDSQGRLVETREWFGDQPHEYRSTIKVYDGLDRVLEERLQDSNGTIIHLACYAYDERGDRTLVQKGDQTIRTEYNAHHHPIKITTGLGQVTHTTYNTQFINAYGQRVLQTVTTDPLGYQTVHIYDTANRLVETIRLDPFSRQVAHQTILYDLCGNACRIKEDVIENGETQKTIETVYLYSEDNQVVALIEAAGTQEQKVTHTFYNHMGQKATLVKPAGNPLSYDYDALGRVRSLRSADGSIDYVYTYNFRNQLTRVIDQSVGYVTELIYDQLGQLIQEKLGHGLSLQYSYDRVGRARYIQLPDQSGIEYVYNAVDLKEIHRLMNKERTYSHFDQIHTLSGQVTQAKLPGQNGEVNYQYNALGHCTLINSTHFQQSVPEQGFDAAGNLICFDAQNTHYTFTYDDHYQVKSETGHTTHSYQFDSLFNRTVKDQELHDHNSLNQVITKGNEQFIYNLNGNLICRKKGEDVIHYAYDALDRLIAVVQNGKTTAYYYDPFNRRLLRKKEGEEQELFVYQGQEEIGLWREGGFEELRLLGKNKRHPMVALELKGTPYVPLNDILGNITCLLDHEGQLVERYRYTVFGESEILTPTGEKLLNSKVGNPWQYASKRLDSETGLVAFGLRYYDPELGRWITPDPAGFADGSNLYAYVHNNPLLYYDQFGLFGDTLIQLFTTNAFTLSYKALQSYYANEAQNPIARPTPIVQHVEVEQFFEDEYQFRVRQGDELAPFERTNTYSLNGDGQFINPKTKESFKLKESSNNGIAFENGIQNRFCDFKNSLEYLGSMSDHNIQGVHSASFGFVKDAILYFRAAWSYVAYEGSRELHKIWYDFFKNCSAQATFLMICHSRGVIYVRNALLSFPEELRNRIEVIAIAPGGYIESYLCKGVKHYVSSGDWVPLLDMAGRERCKDTIITLQPHPNACSWFDHSFTSLTYKKHLEREIKSYNERNSF